MDNQQSDTKGKIALLRGLRQVRQFSSKPVPEEAIDNILEVARWTGSGMNVQPWEFVVVHEHDTLKEITEAEGAGSWLPGATMAIVIVMSGKMKEIETYDEARLTERMMLAAAAFGVGAGIWWFKDSGAAAKRILGIPEDKSVRTAVGLGYPAEEATGKPKRTDARKPLSELAHHGKY
ncbi:MAG: nitroreductase family protein [Chloroflexota bacterium]|nr:nitroreductase family protein [Chloroflexota bacterium]